MTPALAADFTDGQLPFLYATSSRTLTASQYLFQAKTHPQKPELLPELKDQDLFQASAPEGAVAAGFLDIA